MDAPEKVTDAPGDGAAAAAQCPVDHTAGPAADAKPRAVIPASALPGPKLQAMLQVLIYWERPAGFMEWCRKRYGSRFVLSRGIPPRRLYVLTDPDDLRQMFLAPADVLHTGQGSVTIEKFTGQSGLAWLDEDEHKVRRRYLMPSMHGKALKRIETWICEQVRQDVASWPLGHGAQLQPYIFRFTLNVIRQVIFGTQPPTCWPQLQDVLTRMMDFNSRIMSTMMIHRMSPRTVRFLRAARPLGLDEFLKLRERANALIAETISERRSSGVTGDDMLSMLFNITHDDGSPLDGGELRDEMMTIFLAGTETTASALTWALLYLSRDDAVRGRLIAEMESGDGDRGDAYLTATVQEVLRLRPSIPQVIARQVMKPIEIGGVRYEPGDLLWGSGYLMHHDPANYPDPYAFSPERFLGSRPGTYSWIPFGGGRIRCLGADIAIFEMKTVLREVLTRYELRAVAPRLERIRSRIVTIAPADRGRLELRPKSREDSLAAH
jgi:cytochrome P450